MGNRKSLFSSHLYELFFKSQEGQFNLETTPGFPELATRIGLSTLHPTPGSLAVLRSLGLRARRGCGLAGGGGSYVGLAPWQVGESPDAPVGERMEAENSGKSLASTSPGIETHTL